MVLLKDMRLVRGMGINRHMISQTGSSSNTQRLGVLLYIQLIVMAKT
jgi:hypothetical protein